MKTAKQELKSIERVVLCSGKVFYDLAEERDKEKLTGWLLRLEQLYPFPRKALKEHLAETPRQKLLVSGRAEKYGGLDFCA